MLGAHPPLSPNLHLFIRAPPLPPPPPLGLSRPLSCQSLSGVAAHLLKDQPPSSGSAAARMTKAEMGLHRSDPIKPAPCPAWLTQIPHLPPAPPLQPQSDLP